MSRTPHHGLPLVRTLDGQATRRTFELPVDTPCATATHLNAVYFLDPYRSENTPRSGALPSHKVRQLVANGPSHLGRLHRAETVSFRMPSAVADLGTIQPLTSRTEVLKPRLELLTTLDLGAEQRGLELAVPLCACIASTRTTPARSPACSPFCVPCSAPISSPCSWSTTPKDGNGLS